MKWGLLAGVMFLVPFVSAVIDSPIQGVVDRLKFYGILIGVFLVFAIVAIIVLKKIIKGNKDGKKKKDDFVMAAGSSPVPVNPANSSSTKPTVGYSNK